MEEKFYTAKDVAQILKVAYMTVYLWIRAGKLKAYLVQKQYRIKNIDLQSFIEAGSSK